LILGHLPRRPDLRPGPLLRDPDLPAFLDLRRLGTDGGDPRRAALGPARKAAPMTAAKVNRVPWTLLIFLVLLPVPFLGSRFYTFVATDIVILSLFATSLNLLLGTTGLVTFGHAAYFGIGAYTTALLMKNLGMPFLPS